MTDIFVGFIDEKTKKEYDKARQEDPKLFTFLERATDDLKQNPESGIKIPKKFWPKEYVKKYRVDNLWKYDLPNAWRLILNAPKTAAFRRHKNELRSFCAG